MAGDIYVARKSAALVFAGKTVFIEEGSTMAREGHPILESAPEMFEPLFVHFEYDGPPPDSDEKADPKGGDNPRPALEAEEDSKSSDDPRPAPAPKDVRTWAAEQGIEVPARGKLPEAVVEQYQAAHPEA